MDQEKTNKKMSEIIAKCWADDSYKRKLLADPAATLKDEGITLQDGITIKFLENTDKIFNLVIPEKPTDLTDADLAQIAGGWASYLPIINYLPSSDIVMTGGGPGLVSTPFNFTLSND